MLFRSVQVYPIDSRTATCGLGLAVLSIAREIEKNNDVVEVVEFANKICKDINIFFLLDSLDNLQKGGRIGKASYLVGSLLNIKPILNLTDGVIHATEKVRGNKEGKALERLVEILVSKIDPNKPLYCTVGYNNNKEVADVMVGKLDRKSVV